MQPIGFRDLVKMAHKDSSANDRPIIAAGRSAAGRNCSIAPTGTASTRPGASGATARRINPAGRSRHLDASDRCLVGRCSRLLQVWPLALERISGGFPPVESGHSHRRGQLVAWHHAPPRARPRQRVVLVSAGWRPPTGSPAGRPRAEAACRLQRPCGSKLASSRRPLGCLSICRPV